MGSTPTRWDKQNVFGSVTALPEQVKDAWEEAQKVVVPDAYKKIDKVVMTGMGGSLLGARVIDSVYGGEFKYPLALVNDYHLPAWVDERTLVICSSYSGSTEETLSNAREAQGKKAKLMVITAGGELLKFAQTNNLPYYQIVPRYNPSNQPRMAIGYSLVGALVLCQKAGLIELSQAEIDQAVATMKTVKAGEAEVFATKLVDKQIILAAAGHLTGPVHTVKNLLNENAKHLAHRHDLPELNHHLMEGLGWPKTNPATTMFWFIDSDLYSPRMKQRLELTRDVVTKNGLQGSSLKVIAPTKLTQAFELIQFGAYVSFYLSQLHQLDPAAIPWVDYFKKRLQGETYKVHP